LTSAVTYRPGYPAEFCPAYHCHSRRPHAQPHSHRNPARTALLTERGADDVLVDTGDDAFNGLYMEANQATGKVVIQP